MTSSGVGRTDNQTVKCAVAHGEEIRVHRGTGARKTTDCRVVARKTLSRDPRSDMTADKAAWV